VARFRDVLLKFRPFALAQDGTQWYLGLNEEHRITALAPSFSGFLELCSESYDKYFCLDYYLLN
jgi:hypothetical protein